MHRIGRTARAGASGVGITFVLDDQAREVAKFAAELGLEHGLGVEAPAPRAARPQSGSGGGTRSYRPRGRSRSAPVAPANVNGSIEASGSGAPASRLPRNRPNPPLSMLQLTFGGAA